MKEKCADLGVKRAEEARGGGAGLRLTQRAFLSMMALVFFTVLALSGCPSPTAPESYPESYRVTFDSQGGTAVPSRTVSEGELVPEPEAPTRGTDTFRGWYQEAEGTKPWNFATGTVSQDITLYAQWTAYTQTDLAQANERALQGAGAITLTAKKADDSEAVVLIFVGPDHVTLTIDGAAKNYAYGITETAIILVDAGIDGGSVFLGYVINHDGTLTISSGLDKIQDAGLASGPVTSQENTALQKPVNHVVRFDPKGGTPTPTDQYVITGGKATKPGDPALTGNTLAGWYQDEAYTTLWNFDTDRVTADITLYAQWNPVQPDEVVVTFDSQGGSPVDTQTIPKNSRVTKPADPVKGTDTFGGWYLEAACTSPWNFDTDQVTADIILYAQWTANQTETPEASLTAITVVSPPDKIIYIKGEVFNPAGLVLRGIYSDDTTVEPLEGYTLTAPDMQSPGVQEVRASKDGIVSEPFTIKVNNARLISITLTKPPDKTSYAQGEDFDPAGMVITGHYQDGSTQEEGTYQISGYKKNTQGNQTVTISVNNLSVTLPVIVGPPIPASLTIYTIRAQARNYNHKPHPYKSVYRKGENLDLSDMVVGTVSTIGVSSVIVGVSAEDVSGYNPNQAGTQILTLKIGNGTDTFVVDVLDPQPALYFDYGFMRTEADPNGAGKGAGRYSVPLGRTLVLAPVRVLVSDTATYNWQVSGGSYTTGTTSLREGFVFTPSATGTYTVTVTAYDGGASVSASSTVVCVPALSSAPPAYSSGILVKNFAPGQYTTSGSGHGWSLGAWGGYAIWRHRVVKNGTEYSFKVRGNPMGAWCEPGVVSVMQDENNNGIPDDTWYELKGSEYGKSTTVQRYAMTYYKDSQYDEEHDGWKLGHPWVDNQGNVGIMPGGWPHEWGVTGNRVTFTGAKLPLLMNEGNVTTNPGFDWGYVDNMSDFITVDGDDFRFRISDAVQQDGSPVDLPWIDFIKVHTAVYGYNVTLGEISTEVNEGPDGESLTDFPLPEDS